MLFFEQRRENTERRYVWERGDAKMRKERCCGSCQRIERSWKKSISKVWMSEQERETRRKKWGLIRQTARWWISLPPHLFNHFCFVELALGPMWCCSPLLKQVSQTDGLPLMKAKLRESLEDSEISIYSKWRGGRVERKNIVTCHHAIIERHANEVVFHWWILSLPIFF